MRHLSWLAVTAAFLAGGCKSPCGDGACSPAGPLYHPPAARFFQMEKTVFRDDCDDLECSLSGYLTLAKYWPSLDGWATKMTAKKCAKKELLRQQWQTKTYMPVDFKRGYIQAFVDVANGEAGDVPAVPPPRYWNTAFRSAQGRMAADRWFDGYRKGSADARIKLCSLRQIASSQDWMADVSANDVAGSNPANIVAASPPMVTPPQAMSPQAVPVRPPVPYPAAVQQPLMPQPQPDQPMPRSVPPGMAPQPYPPALPNATRPTPQPMQPQPALPSPTLPPRGATGSAVGPGYAAPTEQGPVPQAPAAAIGPAPSPSAAVAAPLPNPAANKPGPAPGYASTTGTSPGGGLPTKLSNRKLEPPPGLFNDPPVWRTKPGHSPLPQQ